jgi:tetrahydromethanopterin S-methyltransferase subunit H
MFSFTKNQETYTLNNITIGGQPGQHPTVLFGGLFFKGTPKINQTKELLQQSLTLGKTTGNPVIPDFFIRKKEYIDDILTFIQNTLPEEYPFSVDIIEPTIKIETLKQLKQRNLLSRTIYNSIHIGITNEEKNALKNNTPEMAIIVAFNPKDRSPDGKIEVLENGAHLTTTGLLELTKKIGINKILIDTAALAPGENSGASIAAIPVIKEEYGLPTGCAIHNVVEKSQWLQDFQHAKPSVDAASNLNIPLFEKDYAIFGPLHHAKLVVPMIAWQDIMISEYTEAYFGITPDENHPRRKYMP